MVTNDIEAMKPGEGCRAAMLTVKGKTVAELVVYAEAEQLLVELDGELRQKVHDYLEKHIVMDDVELADVTADLRELGVYGDDARAAIEQALGRSFEALEPYHLTQVGAVRIAATPELGMPGFHLFGELPVAGTTVDDAAWEVLRVEAGRPRYGVDVDEDRLILEAGMDDAVSLTKGCYLGQEVVARATSRGHINRKLVGLRLDGDRPVAAGAKLSGPERPDAGLVTSSVISPRLGAIALGYLHRSLWEEGTELTVHDRDGERKARVTALPFPR